MGDCVAIHVDQGLFQRLWVSDGKDREGRMELVRAQWPLCKAGVPYVLESEYSSLLLRGLITLRLLNVDFRTRMMRRVNATSLWEIHPRNPGNFLIYQWNGPSETECPEKAACLFRTGKKQASLDHRVLTETSLTKFKRIFRDARM